MKEGDTRQAISSIERENVLKVLNKCPTSKSILKSHTAGASNMLLCALVLVSVFVISCLPKDIGRSCPYLTKLLGCVAMYSLRLIPTMSYIHLVFYWYRTYSGTLLEDLGRRREPN